LSPSHQTSAARTSKRTLSAWIRHRVHSTACTSTSTSPSTAPNSTPSLSAKAKSWVDVPRGSDRADLKFVANLSRQTTAANSLYLLPELCKTAQQVLLHLDNAERFSSLKMAEKKATAENESKGPVNLSVLLPHNLFWAPDRPHRQGLHAHTKMERKWRTRLLNCLLLAYIPNSLALHTFAVLISRRTIQILLVFLLLYFTRAARSREKETDGWTIIFILGAGCQSGWWEDGCGCGFQIPKTRRIGEGREKKGIAFIANEWNADDEMEGGRRVK
jgi:hypothetical protein